MIKFIRNNNTGILEVWENGEKIGEIITMGDEIIREGEEDGRQNRSNQRDQQPGKG